MAQLPRTLSLVWFALLAIGLVAGTWWLRAPSFGFKTWNVDEAIHASVARTLLDGGVLYRDAVDQRTPLTYVAMAGILGLAGTDNLAAVHASLALLIAATGGLLFLALRRPVGTAAAIWAALLYPTLATTLFYVGDANAFVTEWFVAFFTSAAAWCFFGPARPRVFLTGVCGALAFLSKQPGALDLAAPFVVLVLWSRVTGENGPKLTRALAALAAGFATPVLLVVAYYAARGALGDFVFYTWTYNLSFYGPAIGTADRLATALLPLRLLAEAVPLLLALGLASTAVLFFRLLKPATTSPATRVWRLYLLVWALSATAGTAAGGRGFDHYAIQVLPVICAGAGWALGWLTTCAGVPSPSLGNRVGAAVAIATVVASVAVEVSHARARTLPIDPSWRVARFIAERTAANERVFVWGYQPDIYLFADRAPASRFVYASFQTGLLPWTNVAPEIDTSATIVPGAMETLLRDLQATRPAFIVDCSAGPNRHWQKYPPERFPALAAFIDQHYVPVETAQFVAQGFQLFAIKDEFRARVPDLVATHVASRDGTVGIFPTGESTRVVRIAASDTAERLCRVELHSGARLLGSVTLAPAAALTLDFALPSNFRRDAPALVARAVCADGAYFESAPFPVEETPSPLGPGELASFAAPFSGGYLSATEVTVRYGAQVATEAGHRYFYAHAPATIRFAVPDTVGSVRGAIGIRPEAYAPDNRAPTDGAVFVVRCTMPDGERRVLFRRTLNPRTIEADRGALDFVIALPSSSGRVLDFGISPGPTGNPASDWTYWRDLTFENYR